MDPVARLRQFNRAVTQHLGVLQTEFLGRKRSIGASRILYEIGSGGTVIRTLRERLALDSGYSSRLIAGLEKEGLVETRKCPSDGRVRLLSLTAKGEKELSMLNLASDAQAQTVLDALSETRRREFLAALDTVERCYKLAAIRIAVEDPRSKAAEQCIASYFAELSTRFTAGFNPQKSISAASEELEPPNGCLLVARSGEQPVGCGALKFHGDMAEIKRMWVSSEQRGMGVGRRILQELEKVAAANSVSILRLETNRSLIEAQALYRTQGYIEVPAFNDEPYAHHWFEKQLQTSA